MNYQTALKCKPETVEEAAEKEFWRSAGSGCLGAGLPETWEAIIAAIRQFESHVADGTPSGV